MENKIIPQIQKWKSCVVSWIAKSKTFNQNNTTTPQVTNKNIFNLADYDART